jgi:hypothetical protein
MLQLTKGQTQGLNTYPFSLRTIATVQSLANPPHHTELDEEPIRTTAHLTYPTTPYLHIITLPTHSQPTYGLILLASRQVRWAISILKALDPPTLPNDSRKALLLQVPTITKRNVNNTRPARDSCTIL